MRWPPMPAGAGGLKGVTTNSEHLMLRIIIYLCLIYRLTRHFYQAFFTRRFLPGVFYQALQIIKPFAGTSPRTPSLTCDAARAGVSASL